MEMKLLHKDLVPEKWFKFSIFDQMANIGMEIERTISGKKINNLEYSNNAFFRALELIDLTVMDPKNKKRLKEILRARELLVDYFMYDNIYGSSDEFWQKYFYDFAYAAAINRGK